MATRFSAVILCLSTAVLAQAPMAVSDLVGRVTSSLAVDRDDRRIAQSLQPVRLSERLSDSTIEMLRGMGAGPETVRQLRALAKNSRALPPPSEEPIGTTPEPSASERAAKLDALREYTDGYLAHLPDFVCTRDARQFLAYTGGSQAFASHRFEDLNLNAPALTAADKRWKAIGSYTVEAAYAKGTDHYKLELVDNKPTTKSFDDLKQKVSWGEFAGALKDIYSSGARFEWDRWEVTGGKRSAVFIYSVDPAHSGYWLCCPRFAAAHRGFVYTDPESGAVRRIVMYAIKLPESSQTKDAGHVLDYGEVAVGDRRYLMPRRSVAYSRSGANELREEIDYRGYRKFSADYKLSFPTAEQPEP